MTKYDNDPINDSPQVPYLKLFSGPSTNGRKVTIFLELIKAPYVFRNFKEYRKITKEEWYLALNPVGKIPFISDVNENGEVFNLSESGAILAYLAEKYDTGNRFSYPVGDKRHWQELEFVFFHSSTLGASQKNYTTTKTDEAKHTALANYKLFEEQLKRNGTGYLVGDHFSLAEAVALPHVHQLYAKFDAESVAGFKELKKWYDNLINLPEVQAAFHKTD